MHCILHVRTADRRRRNWLIGLGMLTAVLYGVSAAVLAHEVSHEMELKDLLEAELPGRLMGEPAFDRYDKEVRSGKTGIVD